MRAANAIWDVEEGRPLWKTIPLSVALTFFTVILLAVIALAVVLTGPLVEFNAEIERSRQIQAGHPAEKEPFLQPRDPARS
jgi:uncharacterized BrkB/YihY/UPF0761 family membrane protein